MRGLGMTLNSPRGIFSSPKFANLQSAFPLTPNPSMLKKAPLIGLLFTCRCFTFIFYILFMPILISIYLLEK